MSIQPPTPNSKRALYSDRDRKPVIPRPSFDTIPDPMQREKRWILWRLEWVPDKRKPGKGNWSKVPYQKNGRRAASNNERHWTYFNDVRTTYLNRDYDGIGFMLGNGWAGVDLDEVLRDGKLTEEASQIRNRFNSYAEVSPSGIGAKVFCRGFWFSDDHKKKLKTGGEIEVYGDGRYFTVTGAALGCADIPDDPTDSQLALDQLAADFAKWDENKGETSISLEMESTTKPTPTVDDASLLELATKASNGAKFAALWRGDTSAHGDDPSRADSALAMMLAFWTDRNASRMDSLFRQSGLYRGKWDEKRGTTTYGQRTITRAIEKTTETYKPGPAATIKIGGNVASSVNEVKPAESNGHTSLIVTPLSRLKAKPVRYLVPGRIPAGKLILAGGRGGEGKSTWSRSLAADISAGRCAFGMVYPDPVRGKVLIVAAEDGAADTILPGLAAHGADLEYIALLEGVRHADKREDFTLRPEHVELVRARLKQSPDIAIIILDPIASYVGRTGKDDHRSTELRQVLDPLSAIAEEFGVTILMLAHLNKSSGEAVDRIAGSAAYRDAVRAAFLVTTDPEDDARRLVVPVKENLPGFDRTSIPFGLQFLSDADADDVMGLPQFADLDDSDRLIIRQQLRRVRFDTPVKIDANEVTKPRGQDKNKVTRCAEWIQKLLKEYAYPSQEIVDAAKRAGFTFDNVKKAKVQLKESGLRNSNMGRLQGEWWSGFGEPKDWQLRPEDPNRISLSALAPPSQHSQHITLSPLSPLFGDSREIQSGETGESEETFERGALFGSNRGLPD